MKTLRIALCLLVLFFSAADGRAAGDVRETLSRNDAGQLRFATLGSIQALGGRRFVVVQDSVTLSGELLLPPGEGPFPAVVMTHGCAGPGYGDATWLPLLREWGYATFMVDSFKERGITGVCANAYVLAALESVPDVYGALRLLVTHPKIDAKRIVLMGFSRGGLVATFAATTWAADRYASGGAPRFRGFVAFYPYCNDSYPEKERLSAPFRIHTGELDDWTPAGPCQEWITRLQGSGQDARMTVYAGAHHSFDAPTGEVVFYSAAGNAARCRPEVEHITGPYPSDSYYATCGARGAHAGRSQEAIGRAVPVVKSELRELFAER